MIEKMELYIYNKQQKTRKRSRPIYIGCGLGYIYSSESVLEVLRPFLSVNEQRLPCSAEDLCILHKLAYRLSTTNLYKLYIKKLKFKK